MITSSTMVKGKLGRPPRAGKRLSGDRVGLRVTEQERIRWQREADRRGVPLAELIREAVEAFIAK